MVEAALTAREGLRSTHEALRSSSAFVWFGMYGYLWASRRAADIPGDRIRRGAAFNGAEGAVPRLHLV